MPYGGGYLEVAEDSQGWRHLAFYPSASSVDPIWLTTGAWELDGGVLAVNEELNLAYVSFRSSSYAFFGLIPFARFRPQLRPRRFAFNRAPRLFCCLAVCHRERSGRFGWLGPENAGTNVS